MFRVPVAAIAIYVMINTCIACPNASPAKEASLSPPHQGSIVREFGLTFDPLLNRSELHPGIDLAAMAGDPVNAMGPGTVVAVGRVGRLGLTVTIDHGAGLVTSFSHLARTLVVEGECVNAETKIGLAGSTGLVTQPTVHVEVRRNDQPIDPRLIIGQEK